MSSAKYWIALLFICGAVYGTVVAARHYRNRGDLDSSEEAKAKYYASLGPVGQFTLTDQRGEPFDSKLLKGHVWVGSIFFANCPGPCWKLNKALAEAQKETPSNVLFVSITCDPENDTPEKLDVYAKHFEADPARWFFLTGNMTEIQRIAKEVFTVTVGKAEHTDRATVFDRSGKARGSYVLTDERDLQKLVKLVDRLDKEPVDGASKGN